MADVSISFTGDDASLIQRIEKQQASIAKLTEKLRQMKAEGKKATNDVGGGLADGARQAMSFATALAGVGTAAGAVMAVAKQIKAEIEAIRNYQSKSSQTQMTLGEARNNALLNIPQDMSPTAMDDFVKRIAKETNLTQTDVYRMAGGPMSARGGLSMGAFQANVELGARLKANLGQNFDAESFTGALLDLSKFTGTSGMQTMGWLRQGAIASRVTNPVMYGRNLVRVIGGAMPNDISPEESAEVFAAGTQLLGDPTGDISKTAALAFLQGTRKEVLPGAWAPNGKGRMARTWTRPTGKTVPERVAELQRTYAKADRATREEMITKFGGGAEGAGLIRGLLAGTPEAMREYEAAQHAISAPTDPSLVPLGDELFQWMRESPGAGLKQGELSGDQLRETILSENVQAALASKIREESQKTLPLILPKSKTEAIMSQWELESSFGENDPAGTMTRILQSLRRGEDVGPGAGFLPNIPGDIERFRYTRFGRWIDRKIGKTEAVPVTPEQDQALTKLEDLISQMVQNQATPTQVEIVNDKRPKQYGGASPHGE